MGELPAPITRTDQILACVHEQLVKNHEELVGLRQDLAGARGGESAPAGKTLLEEPTRPVSRRSGKATR